MRAVNLHHPAGSCTVFNAHLTDDLRRPFVSPPSQSEVYRPITSLLFSVLLRSPLRPAFPSLPPPRLSTSDSHSTFPHPTRPPKPTNMTTNGHSHPVSPPTSIGDLSRKVAIVTGGSSGLVRAICLAYSAAGAFIVDADLRPKPPTTVLLQQSLKGADSITPTVDVINASRSSEEKDGLPLAVFIECNVTKSGSFEKAVVGTVRQYGRLDILVDCAGLAAEASHPDMGLAKRCHETPVEIFDADTAINARGVWLGCKYTAGQMLKQEAHSSEFLCPSECRRCEMIH